MRILLPLLLVACGDNDDASSTDDTGGFIRDDTDTFDDEEGCENDFDCDGFTTDVDCDDTDPFTNPEAQDIPYDGIDNDCEGGDNNDIDGDGYVGEPAGGDDCNDVVVEINPGAAELCYNNIDEDCDGVALAETDGDCDQDGFPSADEELGFGGEDCDDFNEAVRPDADEIWYDGVDQNCDEWSDFDADFDGDRAAPHGGPDCNDADPNINQYTNELWDGIDQNCNTILDDIDPEDALLTLKGTIPTDEGFYGWSLDVIDDLDADGYRDFVVGAPLSEPPGSGSTPAGWVIVGSIDGGAGEPSDTDVALTRIVGEDSGHMLGWDLANVGDLDGDGKDDVLMGAPGNERAYLFTSAQLDDATDFNAREAALFITVNEDGFGGTVSALGLLDDDTIPDVVIGSVGYTDDDLVTMQEDLWIGIWSGAEFDTSGGVDLDDNDTIATLSDSGTGGEAVGGAQLDADGLPDLIVTTDVDGTSKIIIFDSSEMLLGGDRNGSDFGSLRAPSGVRAGVHVGYVEDMDGDGYDEMVVSAPDQDTADGTTAGGVVYIVDEAVGVTGDLDENADIIINGTTTGGGLASVDHNIDFDGDGTADILVSDIGDGSEGAIVSEVYLISGEDIKAGGSYDVTERTASFESDDTSDFLGYTGVGSDLDDDGDIDMLLGAPRANVSAGGLFIYESALK
ncbi:MAG: putative metal-binding motif-containing protein [Myxococcota bacterium]